MYQSTIAPLTGPVYNRKPYNVNILLCTLKEILYSQGRKSGNGDILNIPNHTNKVITKYIISNNLELEKKTNQLATDNVVNQSTCIDKNNYSASKYLKVTLEPNIRKHIPPKYLECKILGITVYALL